MSGWRSRALCRTRPADWWEVGDDGNRLAIQLCVVACPVRDRCLRGDPAPHGVIRGGVAYLDTGDRAAVCGCGRPVAPARLSSTSCRACDPPQNTQVPKSWQPRRKLSPGAVESHLDTIAVLVGQGWTDPDIGRRLGVKHSAVRGVRRRFGLVSRAPNAGPRGQQRKGQAA